MRGKMLICNHFFKIYGAGFLPGTLLTETLEEELYLKEWDMHVWSQLSRSQIISYSLMESMECVNFGNRRLFNKLLIIYINIFLNFEKK